MIAHLCQASLKALLLGDTSGEDPNAERSMLQRESARSHDNLACPADRAVIQRRGMSSMLSTRSMTLTRKRTSMSEWSIVSIVWSCAQRASCRSGH